MPAYQYFENVRNFLAAAEELKLPIFEASVFERVRRKKHITRALLIHQPECLYPHSISDSIFYIQENLEGSSTKIVDCILALKNYHEWKQMTGGNGVYKPPRSPLVVHSAGRMQSRTPVLVSRDISRQLDMSGGSNKAVPSASDIKKLEGRLTAFLLISIPHICPKRTYHAFKMHMLNLKKKNVNISEDLMLLCWKIM